MSGGGPFTISEQISIVPPSVVGHGLFGTLTTSPHNVFLLGTSALTSTGLFGLPSIITGIQVAGISGPAFPINFASASDAGMLVGAITVTTSDSSTFSGSITIGGADAASFTLSNGGVYPCNLLVGASNIAAGVYHITLSTNSGASPTLPGVFASGLTAKLLTSSPTLFGVIGRGGTGTATGSGSSAGSFPGQAGMPVGYAATPAVPPPSFATLNGQFWPGAFSALTTGTTVSAGTATAGAGTSANPYIFAFKDFNLGSGGLAISLPNCIFVGCRFQSNDFANYNVHVGGANINFIYCSFTPLASKWASPPNGAWPSAGAGLGITIDSAAYTNTGGYCIPASDAYQYGIDMTGTSGPSTADFCDCWGMGNCFHNLNSANLAAVTISNCWIHDNCNANVSPGGAQTNYHTDGIFNGGNNTSNHHVTITNCTIASIGNTNGIAFQTASTAYSFITVSGCFLSGYGNLMDIGHNVSGNNNLTITNNTFGTDITWYFSPLYTNFGTQFAIGNANNNIWSGNIFKVLAGTSKASTATFNWTTADDGKFLLPNITLATVDWH